MSVLFTHMFTTGLSIPNLKYSKIQNYLSTYVKTVQVLKISDYQVRNFTDSVHMSRTLNLRL